MSKQNCPICDTPIEISSRVGQRLTCPNCSAQLALRKYHGQVVLACAVCREIEFDPSNCEECGHRQEKRRLLEEGRL
ncbi:MAG: hypothetical protein JW782_04940 [Candidatus Saganbacteria bacterium]|nr:hypothetical protein [Candidatus Saganbacteria bacterium]